MIDLSQFDRATPGPWVAMPEDQGSVYGDPYCTIDDGTRSIAYVMLTDRARMKPLPEWRANAALMAASPALLSEVRRLKELIELVGWRGDGPLSHEQYYCAYCGAHHVDYEQSVHKPDCVVSLARSALSSSPVEKEKK